MKEEPRYSQWCPYCKVPRQKDERFCWNCGAKTVKTIGTTPQHKLNLEEMQKGNLKHYVELSQMTDTTAFLDIIDFPYPQTNREHRTQHTTPQRLMKRIASLWFVREGRPMLCLLVLLAVLLDLGFCEGRERVGVLVMGRPSRIDPLLNIFVSDPLTDPTAVLLRDWGGYDAADIAKSMRLYFPRSYEDLVEFGFIMFLGIDVRFFSPQQTRMLYDAIHRDGLGAMAERSVMSSNTETAVPWAESIISDTFPNDADAVVRLGTWCLMRQVRYVINTNPGVPPVYAAYAGLQGSEYTFPAEGSTACITIPKEGAVVTTYMVGDFNLGYPGSLPDPRFRTPGWVPHSMFWRYGNGTTWSHAERTTEYWDWVHNPYGPDMLMAEILFSAGRRLPDDVVLVHNLRSRFWEYASASSVAMSFLEFIDRFGADTSPIAQRMIRAYETAQEARGLYLDQEYSAALSAMEEALAWMETLMVEALKLRDRALLWIHLVEWLVVTGVFLLAGFGVWTLMIRRRFYREVATTRMLT